MDRQKTLETLQGLAAMALTIDKLRLKRYEADPTDPFSEPYVRIELYYSKLVVSIAKDREEDSMIYSSDPNVIADGTLDDALAVLGEILGELSEYADN